MKAPSEYPCPSLSEIRHGEGVWWHRSGHHEGVVHSDRWDGSWNPEFTFRIDERVFDYLLRKKPGPKGKYGKRGVGGKPRGRPHQIRRASLLLLLHRDNESEWWAKRLSENDTGGSSQDRVKFTIHMPDLSKAIDEYVRKIRKDTGIHSHPVFQGSWISQICRMIETRVLYERYNKSR